MQWFRDLKTLNKIIGLIMLMIVFTGLVGFIGYSSVNHVKKAQTRMYQEQLLPVKWLNAASSQSHAVEATTIEILLVDHDKSKEQKMLVEAKERLDDVGKMLDDYDRTVTIPEEKKRFAMIREMFSLYQNERQKAVDLALAGRKQDAYAYFAKNAAPHIGMINGELEKLAHNAAEEAAVINEHSEKQAADSVKITLLVTVAAMLLSFGLGLFIARAITKPLALVVQRIQQLAEGDLTATNVNYAAKDEVGQLSAAFDTMATSLRTLIRQVAQSAQQVASASEELTAGAEQSAQAATQVATSIIEVAQGSEQQLRTVGETSAVIEKISSSIQQVAEGARNAVDMADESSNTARDGSLAVQAAMTQMKNIEDTVVNSARAVTRLGERSHEIGQIVDTIAAIAGQTNLLALNAAIEAARAGEQGRGFAVVAEEVRKLAEQSEEAAKQIAGLISEVQAETKQAVAAMNEGTKEVNAGTEVVNTAGGSFTRIATQVEQVSSQIKDISAAIQNIAENSRQIVSAIRAIEEVSRNTVAETQTVSAATEEQSASMEEIAASSQGLARMAQDMEQIVQKFKI